MIIGEHDRFAIEWRLAENLDRRDLWGYVRYWIAGTPTDTSDSLCWLGGLCRMYRFSSQQWGGLAPKPLLGKSAIEVLRLVHKATGDRVFLRRQSDRRIAKLRRRYGSLILSDAESLDDYLVAFVEEEAADRVVGCKYRWQMEVMEDYSLSPPEVFETRLPKGAVREMFEALCTKLEWGDSTMGGSA